ncbi:MAG: hypothetical protein HUK21_07125 [Fibrobacteraceae bacterium]|mgnify:CR=1 FL=1|nr:hypothetical protein [Fibrobacteraceae bacterium]
MKKILSSLLFLAVFGFSAEVQVLNPSGADFSPDAPDMVKTIVRAAIQQTGNTPVDGFADVQARTNLMTLGSSIVVVCEQVVNGTVVGSGKEKAATLDDIDVAIEIAVKSAFANSVQSGDGAAYAPAAASTSEPEVVAVYYVDKSGSGSGEDPNDNFAHKRPTRNYVSYGLGIAAWHNWDEGSYHEGDTKYKNVKMDWDQAFVFHYARIFEVAPIAAITIVNNMNISFSDYFQWHETFLIGGRFFFSSGAVTPYVGAGIGLGMQTDERMSDDNDFAIGMAAGAEVGIILFRNSSVQLEIGGAWDALWDGFDSFDHRFGAGSAYVAINY